jgi:hypothetical protein
MRHEADGVRRRREEKWKKISGSRKVDNEQGRSMPGCSARRAHGEIGIYQGGASAPWQDRLHLELHAILCETQLNHTDHHEDGVNCCRCPSGRRPSQPCKCLPNFAPASSCSVPPSFPSPIRRSCPLLLSLSNKSLPSHLDPQWPPLASLILHKSEAVILSSCASLAWTK